MLGVTDKLYKLYSTENVFIVGLRSIGEENVIGILAHYYLLIEVNINII